MNLPLAVPSPAITSDTSATPLVYSCSGCSSAAQMANYLALKLDRLGVAEMSCIAGVGGDVPSLVKTARSGRPIVALDGCALQCVASILARHELKPTTHIVLRTFGVRKHRGQDFDPVEADKVLQQILANPISRAGPKAQVVGKPIDETDRKLGQIFKRADTKLDFVRKATPSSGNALA